jgi:hypothetical protein
MKKIVNDEEETELWIKWSTVALSILNIIVCIVVAVILIKFYIEDSKLGFDLAELILLIIFFIIWPIRAVFDSIIVLVTNFSDKEQRDKLFNVFKYAFIVSIIIHAAVLIVTTTLFILLYFFYKDIDGYDSELGEMFFVMLAQFGLYFAMTIIYYFLDFHPPKFNRIQFIPLNMSTGPYMIPQNSIPLQFMSAYP